LFIVVRHGICPALSERAGASFNIITIVRVKNIFMKYISVPASPSGFTESAVQTPAGRNQTAGKFFNRKAHLWDRVK
jgi:hypothetical protein